MLNAGELHPRFFHWPSLPFYINVLAYIPYFSLGKMLGVFQTPTDIFGPVQLLVPTITLSLIFAASLEIPAYNMINDGIQLNIVHSRETARIWIQDHLPAGAKVAIEAYSPFVDPHSFSVQGVGRMTDHTPEWYIDKGFVFLVSSSGHVWAFLPRARQLQSRDFVVQSIL
jgi:hypothetical protein